MPPDPGRRLPLLPRQRPEDARRRSAFFRRVPLGRPIARTTSNATRHHVEAWPPLHDFRRILRAHPGVSARPRALDPLITGLASSSMRRSPTSAIGRSASTHLRTPTPVFRIRAARLTPRHVESITGAPDLHQPKAVASLPSDGACAARPRPFRGRAWLAPHHASPLRDGSRGELGPKPSWPGHLMSCEPCVRRRRRRCSH